MKSVALIILLSATLALAFKLKLRDGVTPKKLPAAKFPLPELRPETPWKELRSALLTKGELKAGGFIEADVTDYALRVIPYVDQMIVQAGLDPLQLSDEEKDLFPTGTLNLTNGWIEQLSTLNISGPVIADYSESTSIVNLTLPLSLDQLLIIFNYRYKFLLLNINGSIGAQVTNVRVNLHMGFNFTSDHAFVDKADIRDTGKISIKFTGLGLLDWIIDLLDGVLVTLFHGLILNIVDLIIQNPVDAVVDALNKAIDDLLHHNSTELF